MKIVVDQNIPGIDETFARHGEIERVDGRSLNPARLRNARAVIVRSVTPVGRDLLADTDVEFVGSTTIGTDHLDTEWLGRNGIRWANAPGCNAASAAQYTVAMIVLSCRRLDIKLSDCRVGVVGLGNVGRRVSQLLSLLGAGEQRVCDPPLAKFGEQTGQTEFYPMTAMSSCDLVTLHVPLTQSGAYPTLDLVDDDFLRSLPENALLINTSRGKVTNGPALQHWLSRGNCHAALDVFPGEPEIAPELLASCTVATPHVAGYSVDGKLNGCSMIYRDFCTFFGFKQESNDLATSLPHEQMVLSGRERLEDIILRVCPVERDDTNLREAQQAGDDHLAGLFDRLRREYPPRRDFAGWMLQGDAPLDLLAQLRNLGFH